MASKTTGYLGKVQIDDGAVHNIGSTAYGICSSPSEQQNKVVEMTGFFLTEGATIHVKFENDNQLQDGSQPTLNVNSTGAKPLVGSWNANDVCACTYDGASWVINGKDVKIVDGDFISYDKPSGTISKAAPILINITEDTRVSDLSSNDVTALLEEKDRDIVVHMVNNYDNTEENMNVVMHRVYSEDGVNVLHLTGLAYNNDETWLYYITIDEGKNVTLVSKQIDCDSQSCGNWQQPNGTNGKFTKMCSIPGDSDVVVSLSRLVDGYSETNMVWVSNHYTTSVVSIKDWGLRMSVSAQGRASTLYIPSFTQDDTQVSVIYNYCVISNNSDDVDVVWFNELHEVNEASAGREATVLEGGSSSEMVFGCDDVVTARLGSDYHLPTSADWQELIDNCDVGFDSDPTFEGWVFTSKHNGKQLKVPRTGFYHSSGYQSHFDVSANYYLCANKGVIIGMSYPPFFVDFSTMSSTTKLEIITSGFSARGVSEHQHSDTVDLGLPSNLQWCTKNVGKSTEPRNSGYYCWGENEEKDNYTYFNHKYITVFDYVSGDFEMSKYNDVDGLTVLTRDAVAKKGKIVVDENVNILKFVDENGVEYQYVKPDVKSDRVGMTVIRDYDGEFVFDCDLDEFRGRVLNGGMTMPCQIIDCFSDNYIAYDSGSIMIDVLGGSFYCTFIGYDMVGYNNEPYTMFNRKIGIYVDSKTEKDGKLVSHGTLGYNYYMSTIPSLNDVDVSRKEDFLLNKRYVDAPYLDNYDLKFSNSTSNGRIGEVKLYAKSKDYGVFLYPAIQLSTSEVNSSEYSALSGITAFGYTATSDDYSSNLTEAIISSQSYNKIGVIRIMWPSSQYVQGTAYLHKISGRFDGMYEPKHIEVSGIMPTSKEFQQMSRCRITAKCDTTFTSSFGDSYDDEASLTNRRQCFKTPFRLKKGQSAELMLLENGWDLIHGGLPLTAPFCVEIDENNFGAYMRYVPTYDGFMIMLPSIGDWVFKIKRVGQPGPTQVRILGAYLGSWCLDVNFNQIKKPCEMTTIKILVDTDYNYGGDFHQFVFHGVPGMIQDDGSAIEVDDVPMYTFAGNSNLVSTSNTYVSAVFCDGLWYLNHY